MPSQDLLSSGQEDPLNVLTRPLGGGGLQLLPPEGPTFHNSFVQPDMEKDRATGGLGAGGWRIGKKEKSQGSERV